MTTTNGFLGREAFVDGPQRRYLETEIEGFGKVRIRNLSDKEQSEFETSSLNPATLKPDTRRLASSRRRLIALCLVDQDGKRILTGADLPALAELDGRITTKLHEICQRHCGMLEDDEGPAKND